jgi:MoaA/NifB/PqqE/SkfB family radical SAM enzyme
MSDSMTTKLALRIAGRTAWNMIVKKPICIALEVTHNCTANCRHCDKGPKVEDNAVGPAEYKRICEELSPAVIQIAGGEPLKRADIVEIVKAVNNPEHPPYLVLVSNASLFTKEKYLKLRDAGIKQFSISLDFPDNRHDDFRRIPGLFDHLNRLVPEILSLGNGDVVINTCITRANYPYLPDIIKVVAGWGAKLNFSTYTDLRTHDDQYNLQHPKDTARLNHIIDEIYSNGFGRECVMTSKKVMRRFSRFYENDKYMPNCRTGHKFLIVNPDGRLTPCAMFIEERYSSQKELIEKFANKTSCGGCYVAIRANTEKGLWELLTDNLRTLKLTASTAQKSKALANQI